MNQVPYYILKKVAVIRELNYPYYIDEDGYGTTTIDSITVEFFVDEYGQIDLNQVKIL